jgi:NADPH-dependent curcumin reductase CurA
MIYGQIAKIKGCRVVGIVGSDEKSELIKRQFKFDAAINYKTALHAQSLLDDIKKTCPNGVDVYFDNVGGPISDLVIQNMNAHGRVAICGQISLYNLKNIPKDRDVEPLLLTRSISMKGFSISDFEDQFSEATRQLSQWLADGKLESSETIIDGFENLPKALIGLFSGNNIGKMIVKAAA